MASVAYQGVRKRFGDKEIVRGVTLEVTDGELLVLVGPSGCGKSTLLRLLAGLEHADEGELRIGERRVNDLSPKDRDVAMVFQSYALYPHKTVAQNLAFPLELRRRPAADIRKEIDRVRGILGLTELLARYPRQLSGGQRQRVAMGRAMVRSPKVFLFDEPLSNLDAALRNQMRIEIRRLHRQLQATMLYVTHDQVEAMTLADRIAVLDGGVVQQLGAPDVIYSRPANRFVAGFIGSPAMNFLEASVNDGMLTGDGFSLPVPAGANVQAGSDVVVGLRPHDLQLTPGGDNDGHATITARLDVVEPLGWEAHLHVVIGSKPAIARAEGATLPDEGQPVQLSVDTGRLHLFDAGTGVSLTNGA